MTSDTMQRYWPVSKTSGGDANAPGGGNGGGWRLDESWLLEQARRIALGYGYELDQGFEAAFLAALRGRNVEEDDKHTEKQALAAVQELILVGIAHSGDGNVLTAEVFDLSLRDLCPLWPFCS